MLYIVYNVYIYTYMYAVYTMIIFYVCVYAHTHPLWRLDFFLLLLKLKKNFLEGE